MKNFRIEIVSKSLIWMEFYNATAKHYVKKMFFLDTKTARKEEDCSNFSCYKFGMLIS